MDKSPIVKKLLENFASDKTKDYTYLTIFFLVFAIFIFFAIRPSLVTAFSLRKEESDLRKVDALYDQTIDSVVTNQTFLETVRDKLPLLSEAIPDGPNVNQILDDLQRASSENGVPLTNLSVNEVSLVESTTKGKKSLIIQAETSSDFPKVLNLVKILQNQRRLKNIKMIDVDNTTGQESSQSAGLKVRMEIEGFYL